MRKETWMNYAQNFTDSIKYHCSDCHGWLSIFVSYFWMCWFLLRQQFMQAKYRFISQPELILCASILPILHNCYPEPCFISQKCFIFKTKLSSIICDLNVTFEWLPWYVIDLYLTVTVHLRWHSNPIDAFKPSAWLVSNEEGVLFQCPKLLKLRI